MGFIRQRNSYKNMVRFLNMIQFFHQKFLPGVLISLDAKKTFDRVEWSYLFGTLHLFGFSWNLINWIKLLYNNPYSAVLTNGVRSSNFQILKGNRQGYLISPLFFALAIEPLAKAVRAQADIHGPYIGQIQHKMTLYAGDVLVVLNQPEISIPSLVETINKFSDISGYKINFNKSEVMPLGSLKQKLRALLYFMYLGIRVTLAFDQMHKCNFALLFEQVKLDLERWKSLPMNILPKLFT